MATPEYPAAPPAPQSDQQPNGTDVLGRRVAAAVIDFVPLILLFVLLSVLLGDASADEDGASANVQGAPALLLFALTLAYYGAFEATLGATPGKLLLGLRVVTESGGKPTSGAIVIRTLLRIVDGFCFYAVGLIAVLASGPRRQRLGDMAAKTRVVRAS